MSMSQSFKEKSKAKAIQLEQIQRQMSETVDAVGIAKRAAVPYPSTYTGTSVADTGPIPTDGHLVPSGNTVMMTPPADFSVDDQDHDILGLSGSPYAMYSKGSTSVFTGKPPAGTPIQPVRARTSDEEEMWIAQAKEWVLQKNAYNPDIAAAQRTNVRKSAQLAAPPLDKPQDPARTSENVRAALSDSSVTGAAPTRPKQKLTARDAFPTYLF